MDGIREARGEIEGHILAEINNGFFQHQRLRPNILTRLPEVQLLQVWAKRGCKQQLHNEENPLADDPDFADRVRVQLWAAVFIEGTEHPEHVHTGALCSGVYYSASPAGESAPLVLHDPRIAVAGPQASAPGSQFEFHPEAGDLVLFPPWLTHHVGAHTSAKRRIAWSFNIYDASR